MKPKNKRQKWVFALSKRLPKISEAQKRWAYHHCFEHIARKLKKGEISCMECGGVWTDKSLTAEKTVCPHCGTELIVKESRAHKFHQIEYLCVVTVRKEYQVLRFFHLECYSRKGVANNYSCREAVQRWITAEGKCTTVALLRPIFCFNGYWNWASNLEIRPCKYIHDIEPTCVYPRIKTIAEISRNGFKGEFHNLTPFEIFHSILTDSRIETLLKAGQFSLLHYFVRNSRKLNLYWNSAKIAIRKQYMIDDGSIWCDYLDLLHSFNKDIRNPQLICPQDLKREHDILVERRNRINERERAERERRWAIEDARRKAERAKSAKDKMKANERIFKKMRAKFFDIEFSDEQIQVRALRSVQEFLEEGRELRHCVFTNEYFLRPESLILSATVDGKRVETIEVSLDTMRINQCRGTLNKDTEYHDRIINLVNRNIKHIRRRMTA